MPTEALVAAATSLAPDTTWSGLDQVGLAKGERGEGDGEDGSFDLPQTEMIQHDAFPGSDEEANRFVHT